MLGIIHWLRSAALKLFKKPPEPSIISRCTLEWAAACMRLAFRPLTVMKSSQNTPSIAPRTPPPSNSEDPQDFERVWYRVYPAFTQRACDSTCGTSFAGCRSGNSFAMRHARLSRSVSSVSRFFGCSWIRLEPRDCCARGLSLVCSGLASSAPYREIFFLMRSAVDHRRFRVICLEWQPCVVYDRFSANVFREGTSLIAVMNPDALQNHNNVEPREFHLGLRLHEFSIGQRRIQF